MLKGLIYIIVLIFTMWSLESIKINNIFKTNRKYQAAVVYILLTISVSYLVTNFFFDFYESTRFIN